MSVIFNDPFDVDEDSEILGLVRRDELCKTPPVLLEPENNDAACKAAHFPKPTRYLHKPRKRTLELAVPKLRIVENNVETYHETLGSTRVETLVNLINEIQDPKIKKRKLSFEMKNKNRLRRLKHPKYSGNPRNRTLELAQPKLRTIENNVARYNQTLAPNKVVTLVNLIHEIQEPKPKNRLWPPKKTKKLSKRKNKVCNKERAAKEWLERQASKTATLVMAYVGRRDNTIPNYKQLTVALQIAKQMRIKKRKDICKRSHEECYKFCEQFAILMDTKCEPYKREQHIEVAKSDTTVRSEDQKHCIFSLRKFADGYLSELSTEKGEEEEEEEEEEKVAEFEMEEEQGVTETPVSFLSLIIENASEIEVPTAADEIETTEGDEIATIKGDETETTEGDELETTKGDDETEDSDILDSLQSDDLITTEKGKIASVRLSVDAYDSEGNVQLEPQDSKRTSADKLEGTKRLSAAQLESTKRSSVGQVEDADSPSVDPVGRQVEDADSPSVDPVGGQVEDTESSVSGEKALDVAKETSSDDRKLPVIEEASESQPVSDAADLEHEPPAEEIYFDLDEQSEDEFMDELYMAVEDIEMMEEESEHSETASVVDEIDLFVDQPAVEIFSAPAGYETEEEEPMGIGGDIETAYEIHPDGTSSYVAWCVYVSWLTEFGKNIEKYSNCLKTFRELVQTDASPETNDVIVHILHNWADYLKDIMRVDHNMVQYFKDKPITRCFKCVHCDIYSIPKDHELPEELLQAVITTIDWKALLQEAEVGCEKLRGTKANLEEPTAIPSDESLEILDITDSEGSGFLIQGLTRFDKKPQVKSSRMSFDKR